MLESLFNTTTTSTSIEFIDAVLTIITSLMLGGVISLTYMKTSRNKVLFTKLCINISFITSCSWNYYTPYWVVMWLEPLV